MSRSNLDGQQIGKKGNETRQRLLEAAGVLFETTPVRDIRATDIARSAGISSATFYLYFENVEAVALTLADALVEPALPLIALAEIDWSDQEDKAINDFVRAYFDFWDAHRFLLRVRNLAAEEGDARFIAARLKISTPLHQAIAGKVAKGQVANDIPEDLHELTVAATILAAMERNASGYRMFPGRFGVSRERLIASTVYLIQSVLHLGVRDLSV